MPSPYRGRGETRISSGEASVKRGRKPAGTVKQKDGGRPSGSRDLGGRTALRPIDAHPGIPSGNAGRGAAPVAPHTGRGIEDMYRELTEEPKKPMARGKG